MSLLECNNVKKVFIKSKKKIQVLNGINLKIEKGESVAITGSSGAGKSTLLHILGTLEKPSSGKVLFGETEK